VIRSDVDTRLAFLPDPDRTEVLDREVRCHLAASLAAIGRALEADLAVPRERLERTVAAVRAAPVPSQVFALYTDIVHAIQADDPSAVQDLLEALAGPALPAPPEARIGTLSDTFLGAGMAERYMRILADDPATPLGLTAASTEEMDYGVALVTAAQDLLRRAAPALADEIDVLARQIVLVSKAPGRLIFQGASTFYLWGCVFLNPAMFPTRIQMAEALTHETAHLLLFGMTGGNPLVENPDSERYASPLRPDPRPIEGIAHATYVLARMMLCLDLLAEYDDLDAAERKAVADARAENERLHRDGVRTTLAHARFTETGRAIFESSLAHYGR
jgi:HEXXH motif-containing protein